MTPEERLTRIEENLLVQTSLVERFERETKERLRARESASERHDSEMAEFRAVTARALDLLERFVEGRSGPNGRLE